MIHHLSGKIPAQNKTYIDYKAAFSPDLVRTIAKRLPQATSQARVIAHHFKKSNKTATARAVYEFVRSQIPYKKDDPQKQNIKLPARFLSDASAGIGSDCKSISLFIASVLSALKLPVAFKFTNYRITQGRIPSHIYVISKDEKGKKIIIDGCFSKFNEEKPYIYSKIKKMQVATLSDNTAELIEETSEELSGRKRRRKRGRKSKSRARSIARARAKAKISSRSKRLVMRSKKFQALLKRQIDPLNIIQRMSPTRTAKFERLPRAKQNRVMGRIQRNIRSRIKRKMRC